MSTPATIPEAVFSDDFRRQPSFPAVLAQANQSPYLVGLLTQLHARGDRVELETASPNAAFFRPGDGDIHIGAGLLPQVDPRTGQPLDPGYHQRFVSMLGHESGHAVLQDRSVAANHPLQARANGLNGEGIALTTEYIVAEQIGGTMWSGPGIQSQLDTTARAQGVDAHVATRSVADPSARWQAFDQSAQQQGASYYAGLNPSTAPNTTYDEYYPETWAVQRVPGVKYDDIDWARVQSGDITIQYNPDRSYAITGAAVPFDDGVHAGRRVDFQAAFTADGRLTSALPLTPNPATAGAPAAPGRLPDGAGIEPAAEPPISPEERQALERAERILGPGVMNRIDPQQRETLCAAVVEHCTRHAQLGLPIQGFLSKDGQTIAFRHEPMQLSEMSVSQAMSQSTSDHLQSAGRIAGAAALAPSDALRDMQPIARSM